MKQWTDRPGLFLLHQPNDFPIQVIPRLVCFLSCSLLRFYNITASNYHAAAKSVSHPIASLISRSSPLKRSQQSPTNILRSSISLFAAEAASYKSWASRGACHTTHSVTFGGRIFTTSTSLSSAASPLPGKSRDVNQDKKIYKPTNNGNITCLSILPYRPIWMKDARQQGHLLFSIPLTLLN